MDDRVKIVGGGVKRLAGTKGRSFHCHKMVAEVAQEAAHELYAKLMSDNALYQIWRNRFSDLGPKALEERFCIMYWWRCVPFARATLARLLAQPIDNAQKEAIVEALARDSTLMLGRVSGEALMPKLGELVN